jgi:hypothetical protein
VKGRVCTDAMRAAWLMVTRLLVRTAGCAPTLCVRRVSTQLVWLCGQCSVAVG